jgi:hypothetical protein
MKTNRPNFNFNFNLNPKPRKKAHAHDKNYIEVFDYRLFGLFPVTPGLVSRHTAFAERFAHRRTSFVRRDSLPHLQGPEILVQPKPQEANHHEKI